MLNALFRDAYKTIITNYNRFLVIMPEQLNMGIGKDGEKIYINTELNCSSKYNVKISALLLKNELSFDKLNWLN